MVDVNQDGHVEVLIAVSYYFDKEEYSGRQLDFDPSLYVAGGLACWNLQVKVFIDGEEVIKIGLGRERERERGRERERKRGREGEGEREE